MMHREQARRIQQGMKMSLNMGTMVEDGLFRDTAHGRFIFDMRDAKTGEQLAYFEKDNVITLDGGICMARLAQNSLSPVGGSSLTKGFTMLSIGSGATGNILSPDAPQPTQRKINNQSARKAFSSAQFRNAAGAAVSYPTNIVDFTTIFGEAEATGVLNEMGLISAWSSNPALLPIPWVTPAAPYDPTLDVTNCDLLINYSTFGVIVKPATAILTITWRISF